MNGYTLGSGHFTAKVGAAASLAGLLFVALSINLVRIVSYSKLPARAAGTPSAACRRGLQRRAAPPKRAQLWHRVVGSLGTFVVVVGAAQRRQGPDHPPIPDGGSDPVCQACGPEPCRWLCAD